VTTSGYYVEAGTSAGSVGNITVTGAGSVLRLAGTSPSIYLGLGGNGTLTVTNGGLLDAGNDSVSVGGSGNGTLTVDGATAQNVRGLTIGDNGTVVVQNGGNLAASYYDTNTYNGGWANLTVTGTNSTFYNLGTQAVIGDSGQANLSITAGGLVDGGAANFWAGYSAGATGFIDVNAGTLGNVSNLLLGYYGNGTLTEENGGSVTANALTLGLQANATGTVVVDGVNATLAITGSEAFIVGDAGAGNLTVTNGGSVDAYQNNVLLGNQTGGSGAVVVDGAGSSLGNIGLLAVGAEGNGTLTAQNGAHVNAGQVEIGWLSGGNGAVLLTGLGTVMNTTAVFIGDSGNGALAINSSAVWDNGGGQVDIADANGSNGSVVVNGGIFQNIGEFDVGCCGNGSLAILGGGNVTAGTMYIAVMAGNTGAVAVTGTGSILNITAGGTGLTVGEGGSGALYIGSGGTVDNQASDAIVGMNEGSYGNVTVDGGVWQNVNLLQLGLAGNVDMTVMNGGCVTTNALTLGGTNTSIANLTVTGAGSKVLLSLGSGLLVGDQGAGNLVITQGGLVDLNGSLAQLGNAAGSTGVITISNNGTLVAGDMNVGINGTANISILDGGNLSGQQVLLATNDPGSTGVITVSNATFTAATFLGVGQYGYGELDVLSGGNVTSLGTMALGSNAGSAGNVTVSGAGSVLNAEAGLEVGVDGTGNLTVANGGSVDASLLYVGESTGSGTVDVTGTNSTLLAESGIAVGFEGNGTLTVENGGTVTVPDGGEVLITALPGSNGTVNLGNNGTLQVGGADGIEAGSGVSTFNMLGGTVKVIGSDFSTAVNATLAANTTSTVNTSGYNATWSGVLDGAGGLAKDGPGMFTLSAANTYTGLTTVQQGKLNVTGSLAGDVLVQTGATLTGNGVTTGDLTTQPGGVISPAYGTGANLTAKDFTWGGSTNGNATAIFQLSLVDNTASVLALTGNFIKGTGTTFKFDFQLSGGGSPETPRVYNLITFAGLEDEGNGLFTVGDLTYTGLRPNYSGYFTLNPNSLTFTVVPEPAVGAALAGLAVLGAAAWRRRKRV
jgi:T5SS/PEP-CTERM-associated repeat protein